MAPDFIDRRKLTERFLWNTGSLVDGRFIEGWSDYDDPRRTRRGQGLSYDRWAGAFSGAGVCTFGYRKGASKTGHPQCQVFKKLVILKFDGIDHINDIEMYKGRNLWIPREEGQELGEDEYYIADLLGLRVLLEDGTEFGTLKDVMETGANDVYVVTAENGREVLLPAIRECILNVNTEKGTMTVHLMKGLI